MAHWNWGGHCPQLAQPSSAPVPANAQPAGRIRSTCNWGGGGLRRQRGAHWVSWHKEQYKGRWQVAAAVVGCSTRPVTADRGVKPESYRWMCYYPCGVEGLGCSSKGCNGTLSTSILPACESHQKVKTAQFWWHPYSLGVKDDPIQETQKPGKKSEGDFCMLWASLFPGQYPHDYDKQSSHSDTSVAPKKITLYLINAVSVTSPSQTLTWPRRKGSGQKTVMTSRSITFCSICSGNN